MEMNPTVVIAAVVAVAATFLLIRWSRRHEAPPPVDVPVARPAASTTATRDDRDSAPLVEWLLARASEQTGMNIAGDALARDRIAQAAVDAMHELREGRTASINLPFLAADPSGPKHFAIRLRRNLGSSFEVEA